MGQAGVGQAQRLRPHPQVQKGSRRQRCSRPCCSRQTTPRTAGRPETIRARTRPRRSSQRKIPPPQLARTVGGPNRAGIHTQPAPASPATSRDLLRTQNRQKPPHARNGGHPVPRHRVPGPHPRPALPRPLCRLRKRPPRRHPQGYGPDDLDHLDYLSFPTMAALNSAQGGAELIAAVNAYGSEVVVIDTVSRAIDGEENSNDTWLAFYLHTGLQLKQLGVSMIRLDHSGKDESKGMRGGSAKAGDVDAFWLLPRLTDTKYVWSAAPTGCNLIASC